MHGHRDRYNKEHLKRFSQFRFHDKDPDNDKEEIRNEAQGNRLVSPDLEIGLMSMALGERSVISIGKEKAMIVVPDVMPMLYFMRLFIKKLDVHVVGTRQKRERKFIWNRTNRQKHTYS